MAAAGGISCNVDHHRGFNSVQLFRQFHRMLRVVDFFNGKTKGRFDPQAAMLHDQPDVGGCIQTADGREAAGCGCSGIEPHQVRILVFHPVSDLSGAGDYAPADDGGHIAFCHACGSHSVTAGIGSTEFVFTALFSGIVGTGLAASRRFCTASVTFVFRFLVGAVVVIIRRIYLKKNGTSQTIAPAVI